MKYEVDFNDLKGQDKINAALAECRAFWGAERYNKIMAAMRTHAQPDREHFHFIMGFAGIAGYPVDAIYNTLWTES